MANQVTYILSLKDLFTQKMKEAEGATDRLDKKFNSTERTLSNLKQTAIGVFSGLAIKSFGEDILNSALKIDSLNSSLKYTEGSTEGAARRFDYLAAISDKLGLATESAAQGYSIIAAAAKGTSLQGLETQRVFEGVATAASVLHLSGEKTEGALLAISQMMSKGKVSAEELRGQLGERIPGAFQIAARAMKMSTAELDKFMSDGKLLATDFIPRFSAQLQKEFGSNIPDASESTTMSVARMKNAYFLFEKELSDQARPAIITISKVLTGMTNALRSGITWMKEHSTIVKTAAVFLGTLAAGILTYNAYVFLAKKATMAWAAAQTFLNGTMAINPVNVVITAVAALAAGIYYAYQKSEEFRASLWGIWQVAKDLVVTLYEVGKALLFPSIENIDKAVAAGSNFSIKGSFDKGYGLSKNNDAFDKKKEARAADGIALSSDISPSPGASGTTSMSLSPKAERVGKPAVTNLTINIGKFQESIVFHTTNLKESASKVAEEVNKMLLSAVNDVNRIATP
jgi:tape measure domain-containing protein